MAALPFPWTTPFLAALREWPVLAHAAQAVGIDRSTAWRRIQADPEFKRAVDEAMEAGIDRAELEAFKRGVVGFEEPVVSQGRMVYRMQRVVRDDGSVDFEPLLDEDGQPVPLTVRKHSDALLSLVLKARRKQVYAERVETTGADGGPVQTQQIVVTTGVPHADDFGDLA